MPDGSQVRVSDAEREMAVAQLRQHAIEGRLSAEELEDRVHIAYRARTRGELDGLVVDLPVPHAPAEAAARPRAERLRRHLASFLSVNGVCVAVWAATGADGGFWPGWVMLGTGIPVFSHLVHSLLGVPEANRGARRRQLRDQGREDQRALRRP